MTANRDALRVFGFASLGSAPLLATPALRHVISTAEYGYICGVGTPHCWACAASLAAALAGLAALLSDRWRPAATPAARRR